MTQNLANIKNTYKIPVERCRNKGLDAILLDIYGVEGCQNELMQMYMHKTQRLCIFGL
jgi:hypothetical protein